MKFCMNNFSKLVYCKVFLANVNSFALCRRASVCPSVVCRLSVCITFVHPSDPTQPIEIFGDISALFNTLVT